MTSKEFREYFELFDDDVKVCIILANPSNRIFYDIKEQFVITDMDSPVICIEVGNEYPMDEEMIAACEEDENLANALPGQMEISDFPEVMP